MKVDLSGVLALKFPVHINGRQYSRPTMILGAFTPKLTFRSPSGALIDLLIADDHVVDFRVDGVYIGGCRNTDEIDDPKLRVLIKQALTDLKGEEQRLDPTHRKERAAEKARTAAESEDRRRKALSNL
jgi:hypothetical protein